MLLSQNMKKGHALTTSAHYLALHQAADRMPKSSWAEEKPTVHKRHSLPSPGKTDA